MANWRELERAVDGIVGAAFGEQVRLSFLKSGVADPDRAAATVNAILHVGAEAAAAGFSVKHAASGAELVLDRATYTGPMPKQGDKVRAIDRDAMPWFEVKSVNARHSNLVVCQLAEA